MSMTRLAGAALVFLCAAALQQPAMTRADTARLAVQDLAKRLKVPLADISVVSESDQIWPDDTFGCLGRKTLEEPVAVPGYAFTLEVQGRRYVYRSDRQGRLRRCDTPKPMADVAGV